MLTTPGDEVVFMDFEDSTLMERSGRSEAERASVIDGGRGGVA